MKTKILYSILPVLNKSITMPLVARLFLILTLCPALCALRPAIAQIPQGFNYQAIARNPADGTPIIDKPMTVRLTIQSDSAGGTGNIIFWQEDHSVTTNSYGLINVIVGKGTKVQGTAVTFSAIDWSITPKFIKTQIDYSGWKTLGSSRLWTVPYSMIAGDLGGAVKKLEVLGEDVASDEALFEVKRKDGETMFAVYNYGVRVFMPLDTLSKARKGGFAVGGFSKAKGTIQNYFVVNPDSIRAYIDTNPDKARKGGFAVGGFDKAKAGNEEYLRVTRDSTRVYINDDTTKARKGGFAVGGFSKAKGANASFLDVATDATGIINPSQNRILWYPIKNAFLTGKVLIQKPDSVGVNSFATGYESNAKGQYSQALGYKAIARGDYSTAIGKNAVANSMNSFALGELAIAKGVESFAFGRGAIAEGMRSYAFGSEGVDSAGTVTGVAWAKGHYSFALGQGSKSLGTGSFSFGIANIASGTYSLALGYESVADGYGSISGGYKSNTIGDFSIAIGYYATASYGAISIGQMTQASGTGSIAIGCRTKATRNFTSTFGFLSEANGLYSFAANNHSIASGTASTAIGDNCDASGYGSFASGGFSSASGSYAVAFGESSKATGNRAVAMGNQNTAGGPYSTAFGSYTNSLGTYSNTTGYHSTARGTLSSSNGYYTIAKPYASFVIGKYNDTTTCYSSTIWDSRDPIFAIGNGNGATYSNAFTVIKNGNTAIGHASPTQMLDVNGNARFRSVSSGTFAYSLNLTSDGTLTTATSDISMKENILQISDALTRVTKLRGVFFNWKNDSTKTKQIGMIAQEVERIVPEIVFTNPVDRLKGINYSQTSALLVEAIKEQQKQIESFKLENDNLKSQLQSLREKVNMIEDLLAKAKDE